MANRAIYDVLKNGSIDELQMVLEHLSKKTGTLNRYCRQVVGEGASGIVYVENIPKYVKKKFDKKDVCIPIVVKKMLQTDADSGVIIRPRGNMLFMQSVNDDNFAPIINSLILSQVFEQGVSPHFVYFAGFANCRDGMMEIYEDVSMNVSRQQYRAIMNSKTGGKLSKSKLNSLFKEKEDNVKLSNISKINILLGSINKKLNEEVTDGILISLFHSLFVMQRNFKMFHLDLHFGNVFIKKLDSEPYFKGIDMSKIKYFRYLFEDDGKKKELFVKNNGFIIKIGDPGRAICSIGNLIIYGADQNFQVAPFEKNNPDYPHKIRAFDPFEYIEFMRRFLEAFGLTSQTMIKMCMEIPLLKDVDLFNKPELYYNKKFMNVEQILGSKYFEQYSSKPKNSGSNILTINYVVD